VGGKLAFFKANSQQVTRAATTALKYIKVL
jgi:hypothetical protein